jgi:hypothetical protein
LFSRRSGVSTTSGIWRLVLVLVAGVALVHLHKAGEQPAALGGIGSLGADGNPLGADLDLRPAGRAQVVVPARTPRGAAVGGAQHEAVAVADVGERSGPPLAGPPPGGGEQEMGLPAMNRPLVRRYSVEWSHKTALAIGCNAAISS